jgi:Multicopper oxidase
LGFLTIYPHQPENGQMTRTPLAVFHVTKGQSYRFRFINSASFSCGLQLQIEKHRMIVIATDSYQHQSRIVDTLLSTAGERFDFVLAAHEEVGTYWIRLRATGPCDGRDIEQFAVLSYNTVAGDEQRLSRPIRRKPIFTDTYDDGVRLNHPNATCYLDTDLDFCVSDLHSYWPQPDAIKQKPDHQFFLSFDNYRIPFDEIFSEQNSDSFMSELN